MLCLFPNNDNNGLGIGLRHRRVGSNTTNKEINSISSLYTSLPMKSIPKKSLWNMPSTDHSFIQENPSVVKTSSSIPENVCSNKFLQTNSIISTKGTVPRISKTDVINLTLQYANTVLVYGFTACSTLQYDSILSQFSSYGTVLFRYPQTPVHPSSKANWIILEYETRLEAEKALCQNGLLLDARLMSSKREEVMILGVMRLDVSIARKLGLITLRQGIAE
jgi:hypothetical protein